MQTCLFNDYNNYMFKFYITDHNTQNLPKVTIVSSLWLEIIISALLSGLYLDTPSQNGVCQWAVSSALLSLTELRGPKQCLHFQCTKKKKKILSAHNFPEVAAFGCSSTISVSTLLGKKKYSPSLWIRSQCQWWEMDLWLIWKCPPWHFLKKKKNDSILLYPDEHWGKD